MIKKFNDFSKNLYNVGDYVLLNDDDINKWAIDRESKIIESFEGNSYRIKSFYKNNKEAVLWITVDEIERLLTPDEIQKYEAKLESIKYNL